MTTGHYTCNMKRKIHRQDIIEAGRELMFLNGYAATGIKDITDKIEIPKGSFYNHFSSKEEFGLEMLKGYSDNGVEVHRRGFLDQSKTPLKRIENFYAQTMEVYKGAWEYKNGCLMSNFSTEMADVNENFRNVLSQGFASQEAIIVQCIEEGQELGEIRSDIAASDLGSFVINGWHGALVRMKAEASARPMEVFVTQIINHLRT